MSQHCLFVYLNTFQLPSRKCRWLRNYFGLLLRCAVRRTCGLGKVVPWSGGQRWRLRPVLVARGGSQPPWPRQWDASGGRDLWLARDSKTLRLVRKAETVGSPPQQCLGTTSNKTLSFPNCCCNRWEFILKGNKDTEIPLIMCNKRYKCWLWSKA